MRLIDKSLVGDKLPSSSDMSTVDSPSRSQYWDSHRKEKSDKVGGAGGGVTTPRRHSNSSSSNDHKSSHSGGTSSNSRHHPKAELKTTPTSVSNHTHSSSKSHDRKRKHSSEEGEDVWTEHKSSSGRIYYYNKRLDKSQWEKPTKGTVKKLKLPPDPRVTSSSSSSNKSTPHSKSHSHTTNPHSHTTTTSSHSHTTSTTPHSHSHYSHTNNTSSGHASSGGRSSHNHHHHYDHNTPKRKSDRKYSSSFSSSSSHSSKAAKNILDTPPISINDKFPTNPSPTLPPPPPPPLPHTPTNHRPLPPDLSSPHVLPYMGTGGMEHMGPTTPIQSYPGGWVGGTEGSGHPLTRTHVLQSQYSQGIPHGSPSLLHSSPYPPLPITPTANTTIPNYLPMYNYDQQTRPVCSSKKLQLPMSRLGAWPQYEDNFPDPGLLKPLPQLPSNDFYSNSLTLLWASPIDIVTKQTDSAQLECLSRTTVDLSYHCGQLARNLLALECCRMKTVSRRTRINDLIETVEQIDKR